MARHLKPAWESPHITIDHLLSLVAARVYIIEKLLAYLREAGKDRRREGGRVRVSVHVHMHAHACTHTRAHSSYETFRFMLMHMHDEYMHTDTRLDTTCTHLQHERLNTAARARTHTFSRTSLSMR